MFKLVFTRALQKFTADLTIINRLWNDVSNHYSSSDRHYHNLAHLEFLLNELMPVKDEVTDWHLLVLSIAYHDIVYDTTRSDNEEKSADLAASVLSGLLTPIQIQNIKEAVLATKGHQYSPNQDINYFTDADLAILGTTSESYIQYTKQIRREYAVYPDFIYSSGRQKILDHFLRMPRIFKTDFFFSRYEMQARNNLKMESELLIKHDHDG